MDGTYKVSPYPAFIAQEVARGEGTGARAMSYRWLNSWIMWGLTVTQAELEYEFSKMCSELPPNFHINPDFDYSKLPRPAQ